MTADDAARTIREALTYVRNYAQGRPSRYWLGSIASDALAALDSLLAQNEDLVCSWCGDDYESDGIVSDCCSCDPASRSSLPSLLKEARKEAQEAVDAGFATDVENAALLAQNAALTKAVVAVHLATPNYGSEGCECGGHGTPARDCPVHWAIWVLEKHEFDFDQSGAREQEGVA